MISFVIPAHNEQELIGQSLDALRSAAAEVGQPYEILIVADGCTDRTAEIAAARGARVIAVEHRQISATRNSGAREATGDVLFFIDADTLATAAALRASLAAIENGAVGGGCVFRYDSQLPWWVRMLYPAGVALGRLLKLVGGCFLFCTREAFVATGGFDERYYAAEELAFIKALKRHGHFVVPRETVLTSGRKLNALSAWESLRILGRFAFRGPRAFRSREGLDIWYAQRRCEPKAD